MVRIVDDGVDFWMNFVCDCGRGYSSWDDAMFHAFRNHFMPNIPLTTKFRYKIQGAFLGRKEPEYEKVMVMKE